MDDPFTAAVVFLNQLVVKDFKRVLDFFSKYWNGGLNGQIKDFFNALTCLNLVRVEDIY